MNNKALETIQRLQARARQGLEGRAGQEESSADTYPYKDPDGMNIYPPDVRICPTCYGVGKVKLNAPGHTKHGMDIKCPRRECPVVRGWQIERAAKLVERHKSQFDNLYSALTFDSWLKLPKDLKAGKEIAALVANYFTQRLFEPFALEEVLEYAAGLERVEALETLRAGQYAVSASAVHLRLGGQVVSLPNSYGNWLVLSGSYGVGKTGLAMAIANRLLENGVFCAYVHLPTYLEDWQDTYNTPAEARKETQELLKMPLIEADVLVVDEANVQEGQGGLASEDKTRLFFNHIIHPRHSAGYGKPTILTTNKSAVKSKERGAESDFKTHWGARVADRIYERAHWLTMGGAVLRHKNQPIEAL